MRAGFHPHRAQPGGSANRRDGGKDPVQPSTHWSWRRGWKFKSLQRQVCLFSSPCLHSWWVRRFLPLPVTSMPTPTLKPQLLPTTRRWEQTRTLWVVDLLRPQYLLHRYFWLYILYLFFGHCLGRKIHYFDKFRHKSQHFGMHYSYDFSVPPLALALWI